MIAQKMGAIFSFRRCLNSHDKRWFLRSTHAGMQALQLPFDLDDVDDVEENCGTVWVTLKNGDVYYITCNQSEDADLQ